MAATRFAGAHAGDIQGPWTVTSMPVCHVVHLVYRFDTGGLENVVVQLINNLPQAQYRHTVIALTQAVPEFVQRIQRPDVEVIGLDKKPGQPFWLYPQVFSLLRRLKPDVLHSCNLAALEFTPVAALAGVPWRVHAEHGWDLGELGPKSASYRRLRKLLKPFVHQFVAVSAPLQQYLSADIGVPAGRLHLIPNGVDTDLFRPVQAGDAPPSGFPFRRDQHWVISMVGRMVPIKNPMLLADAFVLLAGSGVPGTERMRLALVGDGALAQACQQRLQAAGLQDRLWLAGVRADIADILRATDCFVLPSLSEATSCTLQEAMACGLPIVATDVGGNADLLEHGRCGSLVPSGDVQALADAILAHYRAGRPNDLANAARASVRQRYGLTAVMQRYHDLFGKGRGTR